MTFAEFADEADTGNADLEWAVGRHGGGVIRPRAVLGTLTAGCGQGKARFLALLTGQAPPDPAADLLGDDSDAVYRSTGAALVAAFTRPGVLEQIFPSPIGPAPGMRLLQLRITEQLAHGWDRAYRCPGGRLCRCE